MCPYIIAWLSTQDTRALAATWICKAIHLITMQCFINQKALMSFSMVFSNGSGRHGKVTKDTVVCNFTD